MRTPRSLFSLSPRQLLSETRALLAARAGNTVELLEHLAEIDSRRLYVEAAYTSMQAYCVGELVHAPLEAPSCLLVELDDLRHGAAFLHWASSVVAARWLALSG